MKYDDFLGQVQHRAQLSSRGETERVIWATLQTLGERLSGGEAKDFASQLPVPLPQYVLSGLAGWGIPFSLDEFIQVVADREGTDPQRAGLHTQAVCSVLREALSPGEIKDIRSQLPAEYDRLFPPAA
jgi:uncharacterized protein (DUF2267 family)